MFFKIKRLKEYLSPQLGLLLVVDQYGGRKNVAKEYGQPDEGHLPPARRVCPVVFPNSKMIKGVSGAHLDCAEKHWNYHRCHKVVFEVLCFADIFSLSLKWKIS